jgi:tetratricopeptide (TPR) repeat protein
MPDAEASEYLEQADALLKNGQVQEAIALYENALSNLETKYGEDGPQLAECLEELGQAYEAGGRLTDALRIYTRTLRLGRQILGDNDPGIVEMLLKLIQINETLGRPTDALAFCEQAMLAAKQCMPEDSPLTQKIIDRYHHLANLSGKRAQKQLEPETTADPQALSPMRPEKPPQLPPQILSEISFDGNQGQPSSVRPRPAASQKKGTHARGRQEEGRKHVSVGQLAKDFALPVIGLATVAALVSFFLLHNSTGQKTNLPAAQSLTKTGIEALYRTADESKKVHLATSNLALLISGKSALELPYVLAESDWSGLCSGLASSFMEKQIWVEKKESQLKTEDNFVYYAADGPEVLVLAKMARLAGNAQACFLRTGEYPKSVTSDMISQFLFQNPLDGKEETVQIRTLMEKNSDGVEARAGLESGLTSGDEAANAPCKITCYAVQTGITDARGTKLKSTKFFVRGCDRNGLFITPAHIGQAYVICATDAYLMAPELASKARGQDGKGGLKYGERKGKHWPKSKSGQSTQSEPSSQLAPPIKAEQSSQSSQSRPSSQLMLSDQGLQKEKPIKTTRLWLISNPPCPLRFIHYGLPMLLAGLALLAFCCSRMAGVDMKGRTTSSGSTIALILSAVCLAMAALALVAEFVIFA